ncbi:MAG: long-chain-acyl-CoA synthetase, partial [Candidatus Lambdaproteobacteria bacterium]|nr:long-chain-acyl-CoA synthetase [Candidatus Lambdaproteobacteria bacterium]
MSKWDYYGFLFKYLGLIAFKQKTIGKTAEAMAERHGDRPFLLFEDEVHSFKAFNANANRRAHVLRSLGIGKGDVVALMMENRPEYAETLVAIGKLGAVTSAINTNLRAQALQHTIDTAQARKIVVGAECLAGLKDVLPSLAHLTGADVYVDTRWPGDSQPPAGSHALNPLLAQASPDNPPHPPLNSMDLLVYIYTSGTTGLPKAARINHFRWYAAGLAMGTYALRVRPEDTLYCPLPLYHSNGAMIAFGSALVNGAKLALSRGFSASRFWEEATRYQASCFIYIGEVLRYLVNTPPGAYDRKHRVTRILGNGLRPDIWAMFQQRFGVETIREFYASTEGNAVTINMDNVLGSMGKAVLKSSDNTAVVKFDPQREDYVRGAGGFLMPCAPGEVGELLGQIKVTAPFHGYTNPKDTEKKILRNVFKAGDSYFRTGDLVKQDAQGFYYFVDRIGDTFRWKG